MSTPLSSGDTSGYPPCLLQGLFSTTSEINLLQKPMAPLASKMAAYLSILPVTPPFPGLQALGAWASLCPSLSICLHVHPWWEPFGAPSLSVCCAHIATLLAVLQVQCNSHMARIILLDSDPLCTVYCFRHSTAVNWEQVKLTTTLISTFVFHTL